MKLAVPDRVLAHEARMEAKGTAPPKPPRCHGYVNCCRCLVCLRRESRRRPKAKESLAA